MISPIYFHSLDWLTFIAFLGPEPYVCVCVCFLILGILFYYYYLVMVCGFWNLSSLTRESTWALRSENVESWPLNHQGIHFTELFRSRSDIISFKMQPLSEKLSGFLHHISLNLHCILFIYLLHYSTCTLIVQIFIHIKCTCSRELACDGQ